jgi:CRP/FNR family cyclic AMP-dependent transcriptional regulator
MTDERIAWTFKPTGDTRRRAARLRIGEQMAALSQAPLFSDLSKRQLRQIADVSAVASFGEGKEIVKEGVAGSVFYVILEGKAKVTKRGRTLKRLGPGEFFGEMAVLAGTPRTASVVSETQIHCVTLSAKNLRGVLTKEPGLALKVLEHVARRLIEQEHPLVG